MILFRMTGAPASHMLIPPPLSSKSLPSNSGVPENIKLMALPEQPIIELSRITGEPLRSLLEPELKSIPVPQFTMALEIIVGEPLEMETPVALSMSVKPHKIASDVAPAKVTATAPVGAMM
jgi:hypothetical protein